MIIHTPCDGSTKEYADFCHETMKRLASNPGELIFKKWQTRGLSSAAHSSAMNDMIVEIAGDQTDVHLVCDSDTVVVRRGWDDVVKNELASVGIFGVEYEPVGGPYSGIVDAQTYKNVPNAIFMALSPLHPWKGINFGSQHGVYTKITTEKESKIYNLPVGYQVVRDVGWMLPIHIDEHKIPYSTMSHVFDVNSRIVLGDLSLYSEEYHFKNSPFVVHQRGSRKWKFRTEHSKSFYDRTDRYLMNIL